MKIPFAKSGKFAVVIIYPKRAAEHYWFSTPQEAMRCVSLFVEANKNGGEVYYSTGGFAGELSKYSGRTQANCISQSSLFLDIDAKDYDHNSVDECLVELNQWVDKIGFIKPSGIINSGGGLHVYWVCKEEIPMNGWYKLSTALLNATNNNGLKVDPTCTADAARVLRLPNFINNKRGKVVQGIYPAPNEVMQTYSVNELCVALLPHIGTSKPKPVQLLGAFDQPPVYTKKSWDSLDKAITAGGCPLLETARTNPNKVKYALWTGLLSVAQFTDDIDLGITSLCGGHTEFDLHGSINKAATFDGPRTCSVLESNAIDSGFKSPCAGCPNKGNVTSPLLIRPPVAPTVQEVVTADGEVITQELLPLPEGYTTEPIGGGIYHYTQTGDKDEHGNPEYSKELLMRESIRLLGASRFGSGAEQVMSYKFQYLHPKQGLQRFSLSPSDFAGKADGITSKLMNANVDMSRQGPNWRLAVSKFLSALITQFVDKKEAPMTVVQFGPQFEGDESFTLGEYKYHPDGTKEVVNLSSSAERLSTHIPAPPLNIKEVIHRDELIREWNTQLKDVLPHDTLHSIDRFVLASGFATALSPYIVPTRVRGGMIVVNYNGSGSGKSSMVERATHIYSGGDAKLITPDTTMMRFLEERVQVSNALPVSWDEMCKDSDEGAKTLSALALTSTSRKQRERLGSNSDGQWNTWFYATMNPDPHALLGSRGLAAGGALNRVLSLKTDPARFGTGDVLRQAQRKAHALEKWGHKHGGQVGTAWVEYLLPKLDYLRERYQHWEDRFQKECPDLFKGSGERFSVAICVATMVAAEAAFEAGLHPFNVEGLFAYAQIALTRSLDTISDHIINDDELLDELLGGSQDVMLIKDKVGLSIKDKIPSKRVAIRVDTRNDVPITVAITKRYIKEWAMSKRVDATRVINAIANMKGVTSERINLTKGAATATVQGVCLIIPGDLVTDCLKEKDAKYTAPF
jgi:copper chaperone CopZ